MFTNTQLLKFRAFICSTLFLKIVLSLGAAGGLIGCVIISQDAAEKTVQNDTPGKPPKTINETFSKPPVEYEIPTIYTTAIVPGPDKINAIAVEVKEFMVKWDDIVDTNETHEFFNALIETMQFVQPDNSKVPFNTTNKSLNDPNGTEPIFSQPLPIQLNEMKGQLFESLYQVSHTFEHFVDDFAVSIPRFRNETNEILLAFGELFLEAYNRTNLNRFESKYNNNMQPSRNEKVDTSCHARAREALELWETMDSLFKGFESFAFKQLTYQQNSMKRAYTEVFEHLHILILTMDIWSQNQTLVTNTLDDSLISINNRRLSAEKIIETKLVELFISAHKEVSQIYTRFLRNSEVFLITMEAANIDKWEICEQNLVALNSVVIELMEPATRDFQTSIAEVMVELRAGFFQAALAWITNIHHCLGTFSLISAVVNKDLG